MERFIYIRFYSILLGLFLIFNLSCDDDDIPIAEGGLNNFTFELTMTADVTQGEDIDYADFNSAEETVIKISLDQIDEDVGSGGDAAGFAMSKGAIGIGVGAEGLFRVATERDEMLRAVNYVATGFWGEVEVKDTFGVYVLTDVS